MRLQRQGLLLLAVILSAQALSLPPMPSLPAIAIPEFPPWVWIGMVFNGATTIQNFKKKAGLMWRVVTGGKGAACSLCDEIVTRMLDMTGGGDVMDGNEELDCEMVCPFKLKKCVALCNKLKEAIDSSQHYPCQAIGLCPEIDEYGEVPSCKFQWKKASCQPSTACTRTRLLPLPKCELNPGFKKWRKYTSLMTRNVGALAAAVKRLPRCGEEGADENFCINEPSGYGLYAEYLGYILVFVVATFRSVRAIETPGGDDDRQWLTFWMIYFAFTLVERVSAVLLSWFPFYYQFKFLTMAWLIFWEGAALLYTKIHTFLKWLARSIGYAIQNRFPETYKKFIWHRDDISEAAYIEQLERHADYAVLKQVAVLAKEKGIEKVYGSLESPQQIVQRHGSTMLEMLYKTWDELEVRRLEVKLIRAIGLPVMDSTFTGKQGKSDTYCVFSLVPPTDQAIRTQSQVVWKQASMLGRVAGVLSSINRAIFSTYYKRGTAPPTPEGEYGYANSRTVWKTLNPVWNQLLELQVLGGPGDGVDYQGVYKNRAAPFTRLRVELWDQDRLSFDDFIGECSMPLTMLMDGRTHRVSMKLTDPHKIRGGEPQGEVFLELRYNS